jgi:hypothetical protein
LAYHAVQAILFAGRYITSLNTYAGRFAAWLASGGSVVVNDSYKVFNVDCRVRRLPSPLTEQSV